MLVVTMEFLFVLPHSFTHCSKAFEHHCLQGRWCDEPLHVEISMDTDVHVPDSPKMADLFEAVTR